MKEYTITPINTGMVNSNKANYLYHNSTHKYYDVEGNIQLPVTVFLVQSEDKAVSFTDSVRPVLSHAAAIE